MNIFDQVTIGYSPCPNDTYIFYALMHGMVPLHRVAFAEPKLEDVETLNEWAMQGVLDVSKLSFHALGHVLDQYELLNSGAALGRGCGPLLVSGSKDRPANLGDWSIAIPGRYTTAAMLLKLYRPGCRNLKVMRFDTIMDAVSRGEVDGGVIIHESRFTYREQGLECIQDLGAWWEETTALPIPLGCIAASRALDQEMRREIDAAIGASIEWARANPGECDAYIRTHAQELADKVVHSHIDLYVNEYSVHLGEEGHAAVRELLSRGAAAGLFAGKR